MNNISTKKIVSLVLLASSLQILESFFPHPVPAVRLGLANIVSLLVIIYYGLSPAIKISIFRTVVSSLFLGTFLSPSFVLSFCSAITSTIFMGIIYFITQNTMLKFSALGVSLCGAMVHNITQLLLVYLLFIRQKNVFLFFPLLGVSAVITGWITGILANKIIKEISTIDTEVDKQETVQINYQISGLEGYSINYLPFLLSLSFTILIFVFKHFFMQIIIFIVLLILYIVQTNEIKILSTNIKNVLWITIFSFVIFLFFHPYGKIILNAKIFVVTTEGISFALGYNFRIFNIVILTSWLTQQYTKQQLLFLLTKTLFFYPPAGEVITETFFSLPEFLDRIKCELRKLDIVSPKKVFDEISIVFSKFLKL